MNLAGSLGLILDRVFAARARLSMKRFDCSADIYASERSGMPTASGEAYDPWLLSCACDHVPLGSRIRVTSIDRPQFRVDVRVNDRSGRGGQDIELSYVAFCWLADPSRKHLKVRCDLPA